MITYEYFTQLDLRVADILTAEPVEGSEKLVKLGIRVGEEERTLVAGIVKNYPPETLIGKQIVVMANLEPQTLMEIESQGMLLAADTEEGPGLVDPGEKRHNGKYDNVKLSTVD